MPKIFLMEETKATIRIYCHCKQLLIKTTWFLKRFNNMIYCFRIKFFLHFPNSSQLRESIPFGSFQDSRNPESEKLI